MTVLLGDGSGNFSAAPGSPFAAGTSPWFIASGDFNGDGKMDLAVVNQGSNNVTVLLSNGSGFSSSPNSPFSVGSLPFSLALADFDNDGKLDIAVPNYQDNNVTVLMGDGTGDFKPASGSPFAAGTNPRSIATADFNGDGRPDLVIADNFGGNNVTVLLNSFPLPPGPAITNVLNGATFRAGLAPNTYAAVFGRNLSTTSPGRSWTGADFVRNSDGTFNMPTSLDGTSVTVGGVPAYLNYVSPGQLNIITPPGVAGDSIPIVATVNGQITSKTTVTIRGLAPSFFAWDPNTSDFGRYLIAQHADYTNVGKAGLFPDEPANFTTPAKPGETIQLYGTGFGPTSPSIASGLQTDKIYNLSPMPAATLNGQPATVTFAGLIPPLSQVYQVNVTIPPGTPNGDWQLVVTVNGSPSVTGLITVQQ